MRLSRRSSRQQQSGLRERLAQEAARLMIEHGIVDFGLAKRKAAERLGVTQLGALPSNAQIEICLAERQRLFEPESHQDRVRSLRELAVELMAPLSPFEPRLAGPVLAGTATINSVIEVHLFSESIEAVAETLLAHRYSMSHCERRYRFGGGRVSLLPGFRVPVHGELAVLPVFPEKGVREAPLSSVDQRPMQRASLQSVARLLQSHALTE
jgi:hypothetical protein